MQRCCECGKKGWITPPRGIPRGIPRLQVAFVSAYLERSTEPGEVTSNPATRPRLDARSYNFRMPSRLPRRFRGQVRAARCPPSGRLPELSALSSQFRLAYDGKSPVSRAQGHYLLLFPFLEAADGERDDGLGCINKKNHLASYTLLHQPCVHSNYTQLAISSRAN